VHQAFFEEDNGESNPPSGDEEPDHPPEDSEEQPPNQDLVYTPIPPNRKGFSIISIIIWSG
jgi:hypothetical protein